MRLEDLEVGDFATPKSDAGEYLTAGKRYEIIEVSNFKKTAFRSIFYFKVKDDEGQKTTGLTRNCSHSEKGWVFERKKGGSKRKYLK